MHKQRVTATRAVGDRVGRITCTHVYGLNHSAPSVYNHSAPSVYNAAPLRAPGSCCCRWRHSCGGALLLLLLFACGRTLCVEAPASTHPHYGYTCTTAVSQ